MLAGTGQVVDFADPGAEEYVSLLDTDSQSLTERYALPALERMTQSDTESLIAPLQVIQRIQTLGIDPATFDTPEANWKSLYNSVMTRLAPLATAETAQAVNFTGSSLAELNDFWQPTPAARWRSSPCSGDGCHPGGTHWYDPARQRRSADPRQ